jgi:hypothetical protein
MVSRQSSEWPRNASQERDTEAEGHPKLIDPVNIVAVGQFEDAARPDAIAMAIVGALSQLSAVIPRLARLSLTKRNRLRVRVEGVEQYGTDTSLNRSGA